MTKHPAGRRPPITIPSPEVVQQRMDLMRHAIASASIEGVQMDERTKGWVEDFAHGRLSEDDVIARIKADA
jgi:Antitoxin VbhA